MKKLYGIGTGPGDEDYLTLKALKAIDKSLVIFAPNNRGRNMALDTVKNYIGDKKIILIDFPMGKVTKEDYKKAAEKINRYLEKYKIGCFLTIGDPMIYSTFIYIIDEIKKLYKCIDIEVVPGIPSFIAAASKIQKPLTIKGDNFLLCEDLDENILSSVDSLAILKTFKNKTKVISQLEKHNFNYKYIKRVTLDEEEILDNKEEILKDEDYISLILAKRKDV